MVYTLANIEDEHLGELKALESEIGTPLLAMTSIKVEPARLDRERLERIKALEDKLGVVLVAVKQ